MATYAFYPLFLHNIICLTFKGFLLLVVLDQNIVYTYSIYCNKYRNHTLNIYACVQIQSFKFISDISKKLIKTSYFQKILWL